MGRLLITLVGTLLVASGTATLNQLMERSYDAQMRRTANRPLVSRPTQQPGSLLVWAGAECRRGCASGSFDQSGVGWARDRDSAGLSAGVYAR